MKEIGDVLVVSPDSPQSGKGHAITLREPLRMNKVDIFDGVDAYEVSGTPVDCVKLAKNVILKGKKMPDICVSGINHGSNASINILYSGTMSAAMEAALEGIDSIGFSLMDFSWDADFSHSKKYIQEITRQVLEKKHHGVSLLNVNIPRGPLKGVKVCRQGNARWIENFQEGTDPRGEKYYWLTGQFVNLDKGDKTDIKALEKGYVAVVPSQFDLTKYEHIEQFGSLELL